MFLIVYRNGFLILITEGGLKRRRRCQRYYLEGRRKGSVDMFIDNLPGVPDNIRYDGEGLYWIALGTVLHSVFNSP